MSDFYTKQGDDGYTGLLGKGRVPKHHPRPDAFGALDEASAALGMARAQIQDLELNAVLIEIQRDLYVIMAEVARMAETPNLVTRLDETRLSWIEGMIERYGADVEAPKGFMVAGDSVESAYLDFARTQVRRAERKVSRLFHADKLQNPSLLPYLNRLSSFCFLLCLRANQQAGISATTMAKSDNT